MRPFLMRPLKYMFYRFYVYNMESWKDPGPAAMQALAGVSLPILLNIITGFCWVDILTGDKFLEHFWALPKIKIYALSLVPLFLFFIYWAPGNRYKKIIEEFERLAETKSQRQCHMIYIWIYVAFSMIIAFVSMVADK